MLKDRLQFSSPVYLVPSMLEPSVSLEVTEILPAPSEISLLLT